MLPISAQRLHLPLQKKLYVGTRRLDQEYEHYNELHFIITMVGFQK